MILLNINYFANILNGVQIKKYFLGNILLMFNMQNIHQIFLKSITFPYPKCWRYLRKC